MKHIILLLIIIFISVNSYSQDFDLLVKTNGDSYACHIDSISDTHIYLKMKFKSKWVHTNISNSNVSYYQLDTLYKDSIKFKQGTSIILPLKKFVPARVSFNAGIGLPDCFNISLRLLIDPVKIGLSIGTISGLQESGSTFSGDIYFYYVSLKKKRSVKNRNYIRLGTSYLEMESSSHIAEYLYLNIRLGKTLYFSNNVGMEVYYGISVKIYEQFEGLGSSLFSVLPSAGIGFFVGF